MYVRTYVHLLGFFHLLGYVRTYLSHCYRVMMRQRSHAEKVDYQVNYMGKGNILIKSTTSAHIAAHSIPPAHTLTFDVHKFELPKRVFYTDLTRVWC